MARVSVLEARVGALDDGLKDHEQRIRAQDEARWKAAGAMGLLAFLGSGLGAVLIKLVLGH